MNRLPHKIASAIWLGVAALAMPGMAVGQAVNPTLEAGDRINNQASATFFDTARGVFSSITSNTATVIVGEQNEFVLQINNDQERERGQSVNLPHRLVNTGNTTDSYDLNVAQLLTDEFDLANVQIVRDINNNGVFDAGEPVVTEIVAVPPSGVVTLIVVGTVPVNAIPGEQAQLTLTATSQRDPNVSQTVTDTVTVGDGQGNGAEGELLFTKQSTPSCSMPAAPGSIIDYTLRLANTGASTPPAQEIVVGGANLRGVLIQDIIPANTSLVNQAPVSQPASALALVRLWPSRQWIEFTSWNGTDTVQAVGVLFDANSPRIGGQVSFTFEVQVADSITPGTVINNTGFIDVDDNGASEFDTNEVCNTLRPLDENGAGNTAAIRFLQPVLDVRVECSNGTCDGPDHADDDTFEDTGVYRLDTNPDYNLTRDGVYIEVESTSLNITSYDPDMMRLDPNDPNSAVFIVADVQSQLTGDTLQVVLLETAPNSGIFRSIRPIRLSAEDSGAGRFCPADNYVPIYDTANAPTPTCVLQSQSDDTLVVEIIDGDGNQTRLEDRAIVDPLGVVFDTVTNQPVAGAVVRLCNVPLVDNDDPNSPAVTPLDPSSDPTATCIQAENPDNPGTPLPIQTTGAAGSYQYDRIFPGCYFVDVVVDGIDNNNDGTDDYTFPSIVNPVSLPPTRTVTDSSYGRDGFAAQPPAADCGGVPGAFFIGAGDPPEIIDVPVDPDASTIIGEIGGVVLEKAVSNPLAAVGDVVKYTLTLRSESDRAFAGPSDPNRPAGSLARLPFPQIVDTLPYGFRYVEGSARLDGGPLVDNNGVTVEPQGAPGPVITFTLDETLAPGATREITYLLLVTPGARNSDGVNRAIANGGLAGLDVSTQEVQAVVALDEDPLFSDQGYIFGKVYVDADCDDVQTRHEWPIAGVRLYLEDGTYVITDEDGNYSLYGIDPGLHSLKLDTTTLPPGTTLKPLDNRHGAYPSSRFVDLIGSELHRADFAVQCPCGMWNEVEEELAQRRDNTRGDWLLQWYERYRPESARTLANQDPLTRDLSRRNQATADGSISSGQAWGPNAQQGPVASLARGPLVAPLSRIPSIPSPVTTGTISTNSAQAGRQQIALANRGELPEELLQIEQRQTAPDPEQLAPTITRAQAKSGAWVWPRAEETISRDGRFIAVVRAGITPSLVVNGEPVPQSKLGAQIVNNRERAQVMAWYGVELEEGDNLVEVVAQDAFGNRRVLAERSIYRPGAPVAIELRPRTPFLDADGGQSYMAIDVLVRDMHGKPANGVYFVTLESEDGTWLNDDIQDDRPGTQIRVEDGRSAIFLQSSLQPGPVLVRVSDTGSELADRKVINFVAPMRPLIASGLIDITARSSSLSGGGGLLPADAEEFDDEFALDDRAAFFLKGKVRGDVLLTMSYDSDKDRDDELFRDIDPFEFYPVYGDASVKGYDAQSRSKLYVRVERGLNSAMWGDYLTDPIAQRSLSSTRRALTGGNVRLAGRTGAIQVFGARSGSTRRIEEIPGNGTATDYRLANVPIEQNSEVVEIIERDRENIGLIVGVQRLTRFGDYNVDPVEGFLTFSRPIPSQDALTGNPITIRVTYDSVEQSRDDLVAGVRGQLNLGETAQVIGRYTVDDNSETGTEIGGLEARWAIGERHAIGAEAAYMTHEDGTEDGMAVRLEFASKWNRRLETRLDFARADAGFTNRDAAVAAGREELRFNAQYLVTDNTAVRAELIDSASTANDERRRQAEIAVAQRLGLWRLEGGLRFTQQERAGDNDDFTSFRARAERGFKAFGRDGTGHVEWTQDLTNSDRREIEFGLSYSVTEKTRLYARHEVINSLTGFTNLASSTERSNTVIGLESDWLASTKAYTEMRQRGAIDGRSLETATGIRGAFEPVRGVSISPSFEWIDTRSGPNQNDQIAVSLGFADRRHRHAKSTLRVDARWGDRSDYYGMLGTAVQRLSINWTGLLRGELQWEQPTGAEDRLRSNVTLGVARRPKETNVYHMLGLLQYKQEQNFGADERRALIASSHHNIKVSDDLVLSGQLAGKWQRTVFEPQEVSSNVQMVGGRVLWDLGRRFDIDIHAAMLGVQGFESSEVAAGAGINFLVARSLRAGIGYNVSGFRDDDLDPEGYYTRGVYFALQYKFDESLFDWLRPASERNGSGDRP